MKQHNGFFAVITGVNGVGKSTQICDVRIKLMQAQSAHSVEVTKYPHYIVSPFGPILDMYLRGGNPHQLSPKAFQLLQVCEREVYQPTLSSLLNKGSIVLAEDYTSTSYAWGVATGVPLELLVVANNNLLQPDITIVLDGQPWAGSKESGHAHEEQYALLKKVRQNFLDFSRRFGWSVINASRLKEEVTEEILNIIRTKMIIPAA